MKKLAKEGAFGIRPSRPEGKPWERILHFRYSFSERIGKRRCLNIIKGKQKNTGKGFENYYVDGEVR